MEMKRDHIDEVFDKVKRVDTPPFLMTRIQAKLESFEKVTKPQWALVFSTVAVLLVVNFIVIKNSNETNLSESNESIAELYQVNPSNQLYYE